MKVKTVKIMINDKVAECVTIGGLAKICYRGVDYMRKAEERGLLPRANIISAVGQRRLYTVELARTLSELFSKCTQGVPTPEEVKQQIRDAFLEERERLGI